MYVGSSCLLCVLVVLTCCVTSSCCWSAVVVCVGVGGRGVGGCVGGECVSFGVVVRGLAWWVVVSLWVGTGSLAVVCVGGVWVLGHIWGKGGWLELFCLVLL